MRPHNQDLYRAPSELLLIHHMANRDHGHPPGSIPALKACLEAGARAIEIDISLLADGQFALLHGPLLEDETTGFGPVRAFTSKARQLRHTYQGKVAQGPLVCYLRPLNC
jgi:glycerophosphoryl diester phosphodiesterase